MKWLLVLHLLTGDVVCSIPMHSENMCNDWAVVAFVVLSDAGHKFLTPTYTCKPQV